MIRKLTLAAVSLLAFVAPASGQEGAGVAIAVVLDENPPASFAQQALPATDFTVRPSVTSSTLGAGVQTLPLRVFCVNLFTGEIINNCNVVITHTARASSGGHSHTNGTRPKGTFQPASGSTGTAGLPTTYTSPETSGIIDTQLTGTAPDGTPLAPGVFTIGVQIDGLIALGGGANYQLIGITATHPDSHNGTPAMNGALVGLADAYAAAFPNSVLGINDMSLTAGGLFDYQATWAKPHASHRFGVDADLALVPVAQRRRVRQLISAAGLTIIPEGVETHWHVRQ